MSLEEYSAEQEQIISRQSEIIIHLLTELSQFRALTEAEKRYGYGLERS